MSVKSTTVTSMKTEEAWGILPKDEEHSIQEICIALERNLLFSFFFFSM